MPQSALSRPIARSPTFRFSRAARDSSQSRPLPRTGLRSGSRANQTPVIADHKWILRGRGVQCLRVELKIEEFSAPPGFVVFPGVVNDGISEPHATVIQKPRVCSSPALRGVWYAVIVCSLLTDGLWSILAALPPGHGGMMGASRNFPGVRGLFL